MDKKKEVSSFRDPSSYVYYEGKLIFREVDLDQKKVIDGVVDSSLYQSLIDRHLLLPFTWYRYKQLTLKPDLVLSISYPYEWCFSMLKDSALATLDICIEALYKGFILKDASAYNIQYSKGKMVLIDHGSFSSYKEGEPWVAYKQFCQHFLAPLALMVYRDQRLGKLSQNFIDGIPLDLCSSLLPAKSYLNPGILTHIHLHSKSQSINSTTRAKGLKISRLGLLGLLDNLRRTIEKLEIKLDSSYWSGYTKFCTYSQRALSDKIAVVGTLLKSLSYNSLLDLGCNTGLFSSFTTSDTIAVDSDYGSIELIYKKIKLRSYKKEILPLVIDINNPSPNIGWLGKERYSFLERQRPDLIMALALIHHLCIVNNLPFSYLIDLLGRTSKWLIVEWVPKEDLQVQGFLRSREDIFSWYTQEVFEAEFSKVFKIALREPLDDSKRVIYLMEKL